MKGSPQGCGPPADFSYYSLLRLLCKSFPYYLCSFFSWPLFSRV